MGKKADEKRLIATLESLEAVSEKGMPLLPAVPREDGYGWKVWCRYCKAWHSHGIGLGHRGAHCLSHDRRGRPINSPYSAFSDPPGRGYELVLREEALDANGREAARRLVEWEREEEAKSRART
ncbi:MAG: hypothetical protein FJ290_24055 [Planctomycetes bacterium]|nr:hypothetical protein [Planctomycetota bacterium]